MSSILRAMNDQANKVKGMIQSLVRFGVIKAATASGFVQVEGFEDEVFDDIELRQHFGFASRPPAGTEVLLLLVGGRGENAVAISSNSRSDRPDMGAGETSIFNEGAGAKVLCASNDTVRLSGDEVHVGGDSESILLGDSAIAGLSAFFTACSTAIDPIVAAAAVTAMGGVYVPPPGTSIPGPGIGSWAASKGKVT